MKYNFRKNRHIKMKKFFNKKIIIKNNKDIKVKQQINLLKTMKISLLEILLAKRVYLRIVQKEQTLLLKYLLKKVD